jgi:hypothetical protein
MNTAAWAIFFHFNTTRVITAVFNRGVITFFTLGASQVDDWSDVFFL